MVECSGPKRKKQRKDDQLCSCNCPEGVLPVVLMSISCGVLCVCNAYVRTYIYFFFPQGPKEPPIGVLGERKE